MSKKALITGITGQDGAYLAKLLIENSYEVYGGIRRSSVNSTERLRILGIEDHINYVNLEMTDKFNTYSCITENNFDEVYNLAGQSFVGVSWDTPDYTTNVNSIGVLNLLDAIRRNSPETKFYQASTSEMFGLIQEPIQDEKTPFYPRSPYGVSKLYSHWLTVNYRESFNMYCCSGILFNHESPLRGTNFVTKKISQTLSMISLGLSETLKIGNLDARRDWGYAKDYVEGMWLMLQSNEPDDYVLATGVDTSVRQFIELCSSALGIEIIWDGEGVNEIGINKTTGEKIIEVDEKFFRPAEVDVLIGNSNKAKNKLGWTNNLKVEELAELMTRFDYDNLKSN